MDTFNYDAPAELYPSRRYAKSSQAQYRRFSRAADAIRFIVEEVPSTWLTGSFLETDDGRFEGTAIRGLYESDAYPHPRLEVAA